MTDLSSTAPLTTGRRCPPSSAESIAGLLSTRAKIRAAAALAAPASPRKLAVCPTPWRRSAFKEHTHACTHHNNKCCGRTDVNGLIRIFYFGGGERERENGMYYLNHVHHAYTRQTTETEKKRETGTEHRIVVGKGVEEACQSKGMPFHRPIRNDAAEHPRFKDEEARQEVHSTTERPHRSTIYQKKKKEAGKSGGHVPRCRCGACMT